MESNIVMFKIGSRKRKRGYFELSVRGISLPCTFTHTSFLFLFVQAISDIERSFSEILDSVRCQNILRDALFKVFKMI